MPSTSSVSSGGSVMDIYEAAPEGAARAAVIVLQEAFGVNDHIQDICRRLAAEGYLAVAPHLFHRTGDPVFGYDDMQQVMPHVMKLSADTLATDLEATIARLATEGFEPSRIGVVGFCAGGSVTFLAAARYALGAAVTFYGGGIAQGRFGMPPLLELATELQSPWLGLFGDLDQSIPVDEVESLSAAVGEAKVPARIVRYPQAGHGFHCDARSSYHEESAKPAWREALDWLDSHL